MNVLIWIAVLIVVGSVLIYFRNFIVGIWQDGGRGQFLVMGMPAVIFLVLGVTALGLAAVNMERLDLHYENLAQRANERAQQLRDEIIKEQKVIGTTQPGVTGGLVDDERMKELKAVQEQENIYLEKLIRLDPDDPDHKFKLALLAFNQGDPQRGLNLMQMIAPFDEPGYAKGHLFLAQYFLAQKDRSEESIIRNRKRAFLQIQNCLIADETNLDAKKIKAFILDQNKQFLQAYEIYKELFKEDPAHYTDILRLTKILGKDQDAKAFLSQASIKFRQKTNKSTDNVSEWVDAWTNYVQCMKYQQTSNAFREAEEAVKTELLKFNDDIGKKVFLKRQLSRIYSDHVALLGRDASDDVKRMQLTYLANAMENDEKNESALAWLTILGFTSVGDQAKKIYDPNFDPNPPWIVLSEQGHNALNQKNYDDAITFFERARKKQPRNPQVLNNLAYSYLLSPENRNPEQALLLVDQAITNIGQSKVTGKKREEVIASFFDTRGVALMQLNRYKDAAAAFEIAFRNRSTSKEIIERLIECYEKLGNEKQAEAYRRRLEKLG